MALLGDKWRWAESLLTESSANKKRKMLLWFIFFILLATQLSSSHFVNIPSVRRNFLHGLYPIVCHKSKRCNSVFYSVIKRPSRMTWCINLTMKASSQCNVTFQYHYQYLQSSFRSAENTRLFLGLWKLDSVPKEVTYTK